MKKILSLVLVLLLGAQSALALEQNSLFAKIFSLSEEGDIAFVASGELSELYPYTKEQAELYGRALSQFSLHYLASTKEGKTFSSMDLSFADIPLFSQVEFQVDEDYYVLNSLLDKRLFKTNSLNMLYPETVNLLENQVIFDFEIAKEELSTEIAELGELGERKQGSVAIKGFPKASASSTLKIKKDELAEYEDRIVSAVLAGFAKKWKDELYFEPFGAWEAKQFYDKAGELVGLRFSGAANLNEVKHSVDYVLNRSSDFEEYEIILKIKQNNRNYVSLELKYDREGTQHRSKFEQVQAGDVFRQSIESKLKWKQDAKKNSLTGSYTLLEEHSAAGTSREIRLSPKLNIEKQEEIRKLSGDLGLSILENNVILIDAQLHFASNPQTEKLEKLAHAMDVAERNGGLEKNLDYLQSVSKQFGEDFAQDYILLDLDNYSPLLRTGLQKELVELFSAKLLKAMLQQEDHSAYILSYGMQPADWEAFIQEYESKKED